MNSSDSESVDSEVDNVNYGRLSAVSHKKYQQVYKNFIKWKTEKGLNNFTEDVLLAYFEDEAKTKPPSRLWTLYSMLKCTLLVQNDVNIDPYTKLKGFLKEMYRGYVPQKGKMFTKSDVEIFMREAPDSEFLSAKVILIFAILGRCRHKEIVNIKFSDVEKHSDQLLLVKVKDKCGKMDRSFIIRGGYKDIVDKYIGLRPANMPMDRFFIRYQNGKCIKGPIGITGASAVPHQIAEYLKLPDPKSYTGSSFKKTAVSLCANSAVDLIDLKLREENKIDQVFITDSFENITGVESDTQLNSPMVEDIKVEISPSSSISSSSPSPHYFEPEQQGQLSPPPRKKERRHELRSGRIKVTENDNNILNTRTIPFRSKNTTITFENCENITNINIYF